MQRLSTLAHCSGLCRLVISRIRTGQLSMVATCFKVSYISCFLFQVKTGATFLQNHAGRIFRVAVQCRNQNESRQARSTCLLFKVEGTINCKD